MIQPLRFATFFLCTTLVVHRMVAAPVSPAGSEGEPLHPDIATLLAPQPKWGVSAILEASYGFKDNLTLSFAGDERSAFARASAEALAMRAPAGPFELTLFVQGDGTHYFSGKTVTRESSAWVHLEPSYGLGKQVRFSLPIIGYHNDKVFDVSATEVERLVARMKVSGASVGHAIRWDPNAKWWMESQASGARDRFEDGSNNSQAGSGALRLGWKPNGRLKVQLGGERRWRAFDSLQQYTASGRALAGTLRKIAEREGQVSFNFAWDEARRWKTDTRFSAQDYRDNGTGYFNYREKKVAQEFEWNGERWLIRIEGAARRLDHEVQTVGFGIDPPPRIRDEFSAELHVERKLGTRWIVFGTYRWDRDRSNDSFASYRVNEGLLGLRWSWEK